MIYVDCEQGTEEWFRSRCGVITASTFADAVSTVNGLTKQQAIYVDVIRAGGSEAEAMEKADYKAKPKADVVARAIAGLPVGEPSDASQKLAMTKAIERISAQPYGNQGQQGRFFATERGHEGEDFARWRYQTRMRVMVDQAGVALTDDRLFGYSSDGFVGDDGLIEVKVPLDPLKVLHIIQTGDISEYMYQMQGGMWITHRKWCDFLMGVPDLACLNNGNELYIQRVWRDDNFIETMERQLWAFAGRVKALERLLRTPYGETVVTSTPAAPAANESPKLSWREAAAA
ncbi:MAG: lambda exonuclease family protein [Burkholderiales bacterium]